MASYYTTSAKSLHWLMAVMLFGLLSLGFYMTSLSFSPEKLKLYSWHKWAGVSLFVLALVRIGVRLSNPPVPLPSGMRAWEQTAARLGHGLLYALMIIMPLTGWLMSSAKGFQTVWFGVIALPDLVPKNKALGDTLAAVHSALGLGLAALISIHIGAALKHQWIDKIKILDRMLFKFHAKDKPISH